MGTGAFPGGKGRIVTLLTIFLLGGFSVFVGMLIGSVGIGGVLLVPYLTYVLGLDVHVAIAAAMFGYIFVGGVGAGMYARQGSIDWPMAVWLIAGATPAAFAGSLLASLTPETGLKFIIAVLVTLAGLNALRRGRAEIADRKISNPFALLAIGAVIGAGSALTGTGGPLFTVPIMVSLNVAAHTAIGLSQAVQMPLATLATAGNIYFGTVPYLVGGIIAGGLMIGGTIGARLAHVIEPKTMSRVVAWVLVVVGVFLLARLSSSWF